MGFYSDNFFSLFYMIAGELILANLVSILWKGGNWPYIK
jgi:hypothetical protein